MDACIARGGGERDERIAQQLLSLAEIRIRAHISHLQEGNILTNKQDILKHDCLLFISGDVQDEDKLVRAESQAGANLYLYQVRKEQKQTTISLKGSEYRDDFLLFRLVLPPCKYLDISASPKWLSILPLPSRPTALILAFRAHP